VDRDEARQRAWLLFRSLEKVAERDPEQEVRGMAIPVLDACLRAFKDHVPDDPIISAIQDVMSPEAISDGFVRAVDAALVAGQLAWHLDPSTALRARPGGPGGEGDSYAADAGRSHGYGIARSRSACSWYHLRPRSSPRAAASSARRCVSAIVASCSVTRASRSARICGSSLRSDATASPSSKPLVEPTKLVPPFLDTSTVERKVLLILGYKATLSFK
jgi:hypothetical protein